MKFTPLSGHPKARNFASLMRRMERRPNTKKWQPGDLVLHQADPKVHAMLMEILEVKGDRAKTAYLDPGVDCERPANKEPHSWHPLECLHDPMLFLKTEEFSRTLRERDKRR